MVLSKYVILYVLSAAFAFYFNDISVFETNLAKARFHYFHIKCQSRDRRMKCILYYFKSVTRRLRFAVISIAIFSWASR